MDKKLTLHIENPQNRATLPFAFCEMTKVGSMMLRPDMSTGSIINSDCAAEFHTELKHKFCLDALGSFIKGSSEHLYTTISIWVNDNEVTRNLFKGRTFCHLDVNDKLYSSILECLQSVFATHCRMSASTISKLLELQNDTKKKLLTIQLIDFSRQYFDDLYCTTAEAVEQALRNEFPQYANFNYANSVVNNDAIGDFAPIFLFFTPEDLEYAVANKHLERMTDIAYDIIAPSDNLKLLKKELFRPQVISRRDLSGQQLYDIDMNIQFRKRAK